MRETKYKLLDINLQLFDGAAAGAGGAAGDGASAGAQQDGAGALPKAETNRGRGSSRRARSGEFDNVVFGKQDAAEPGTTTSPAAGEHGEGNATKSGVATTSDSLEAKRAAFRELIEGEYKDQYTEMFQQAFNRRFKETKGMENSLNAQKPIIDMLMQRYGVADGDMGKLQKALEEDNAYWSEAAEEAGLTVEQFKAMQKLERENAEFKRMRQQQQAEAQRMQGERQAQQKLNQWYADAEKVKEIYPGFDFKAEIANKEFQGLLKAGLPVQKAYEVLHMDEIKVNAARAASQATGQQMAAKMKAKAARPTENGTSSQSAVITKSDVHSLTRKERAEIARRVQRGEKIKF